MKKILYGTTALVAVGAFAATGAQAAEPIQVTVGGYFQAAFVFVDYDNDDGRRSRTLQREAELIFGGSTTLDNGLQVGVQVQLEAETCADQIDESFIYLAGNWGRLNIGSENSAAYLMHVASAPPSHWAFGLNSPNISLTGNFPHTSPVSLTSDAEKVTYFTPRFAGFQLGASYAPDACEEGGCGGTFSGSEFDDGSDGSVGDVIEIGVNYTGKWNEIEFAASGSYGTADDESTGDGPEEWSAGVRVGYAGFTIGAGYREFDSVIGDETTDWNVGVRYATGPWGVGIQYAAIEIDPNNGNRSDVQAVEVGGSYDLGPGVVLFGGVQYWEGDYDSASARAGTIADDETWVGFIGTMFSF
ncbi:porin [Oceanibacterium hippocampi]|uniref:Porin domain-containing protein n=1 Tax=Oceanibacterium hippocampi TaxID=745714 RepID=A0A1Y5RM51_9PROT|nr:porin [Oceanibacterium hippocampi]SLN20367.1 hypothetical protein OCH7691_00495 [Oceanibacterium hippocampi]